MIAIVIGVIVVAIVLCYVLCKNFELCRYYDEIFQRYWGRDDEED